MSSKVLARENSLKMLSNPVYSGRRPHGSGCIEGSEMGLNP